MQYRFLCVGAGTYVEVWKPNKFYRSIRIDCNINAANYALRLMAAQKRREANKLSADAELFEQLAFQIENDQYAQKKEMDTIQQSNTSSNTPSA